MNKRTKSRIARDLKSGSLRATKKSMESIAKLIPEDKLKDLSKKKR